MGSSIERWRIGSTTLSAVVEAETQVPAGFLLPDATQQDVLAAVGLPAGSVSDDGSKIGFRVVQAFVLEHRLGYPHRGRCMGSNISERHPCLRRR